MKFTIRVVPRSSREKIKQEPGLLKVYVTKPAQDGLANDAVIKLLAEHFKISKSRVNIITGQRSRNKIVEIDE